MKSGLNEFLSGFVEEGKVVTKEDIEAFFEGKKNEHRV
jgi:hypothetical protein